MRRLLTVTMALGLVITAMNFTGIFAVFNDSATTGTNDADSGALQATADIQIGVTDNDHCTGASYSENLVTGVVSVSGLVPGGPASDNLYICLKNVGVAAVAVTATAFDISETEIGCTGDEATYDDTCGTSGIGDGELGTILNGQLLWFDCTTSDGPIGGGFLAIESMAVTPLSIGTIDPGEVACVRSHAYIPDIGGILTGEMAQAAQSDKVEWRYSFDATAP